ncbi:UNVERIFIED_CONTAM: hypothetical protein NCL1_37961 [Trichonephila clavipes]
MGAKSHPSTALESIEQHIDKPNTGTCDQRKRIHRKFNREKAVVSFFFLFAQEKVAFFFPSDEFFSPLGGATAYQLHHSINGQFPNMVTKIDANLALSPTFHYFSPLNHHYNFRNGVACALCNFNIK